MSTHIKGVGGAPGVAIGRAFLYRSDEQSAADPPGEAPDAALARFAAAQEAAARRLRDLAERQRGAGFEDEAGLFEAHALLVEDDFLTDEVTRLVREERAALAAALDVTIGEMRAAMEALDDEYLRDRAADMDAIGQEVRRALYGGPSLAGVPAGAIVVAADLTPAETAELPAAVAGFATAYGGPTGHTVILARARGVPAVVGLGPPALEIADGAELVVDGGAALLIAGPERAELEGYRARIAEQAADDARRATLREQPGRLRDGHPVALWANVGRPEEAELALRHGAEGIGLFRTEFLFLDRKAPPTEEEQLAAYRATLETMGGRTVVVRTIDIGGDKPVPYLALPHEENPFLGVRGLRLCMRRPDLFAIQLRALLRAALYGDLWIMLPMVATPADLAWGREQLRAAAAALEAEGVAHRPDPPLGIMVETPAAAVIADLLARDAAFFSVGSNDLAQYTLAVDRGQAELAARYPHDSAAVLRLIGRAAEAAAGAGIPIGVCGELAGVPAVAPALVGLGVVELSMAPASIPLVKERLAGLTLEDARAAARAATG